VMAIATINSISENPFSRFIWCSSEI